VEPYFFATQDEFRAWFEDHHATATELLVGFHKTKTDRASITWPEAVREALCFGWIDGVRRSLGDESYSIRFTPRRPGSNWSLVNVRHAEELIRVGRMTAAGLEVYRARKPEQTGVYSFEQRHSARLDPEQERQFRAEPKAWAFFDAQAPSYQRTAIHWVVSAKRDATRSRRLARLIEDSAASRRVAQLTSPKRS
jgi:uncharacterized protein YdeI (YjbR/CyaY-like superfamily)